jgi:hypothetical protein
MIPGNRPEDQEWEDLLDFMQEHGLSPRSIKGMLIIQHKLAGPDGLYHRLMQCGCDIARMLVKIQPPLWRPRPLVDLCEAMAALEIIDPLHVFEAERRERDE